MITTRHDQTAGKYVTQSELHTFHSGRVLQQLWED